jgi:hypothetical protein
VGRTLHQFQLRDAPRRVTGVGDDANDEGQGLIAVKMTLVVAAAATVEMTIAR